MARPRVHEKRRSSTSSSPRGVSAQSLTSKSSVRLTRERRRRAADQKAEDIAGGVEAALGDRDQRAGERPTWRRLDQAFEAAIVRQRLDAGGTGIGWPRARRPSWPKSKRTISCDALDADIERAAVVGERLGVVPAARVASGRPSGPSIGAISASAIAIGGRRDRRCARAASGPCRSPRGNARRRPIMRSADRPPNSRFGEISTSPPRNRSAPNRVREASRGSNASIACGGSRCAGLAAPACAAAAPRREARASSRTAAMRGRQARRFSPRSGEHTQTRRVD